MLGAAQPLEAGDGRVPQLFDLSEEVAFAANLMPFTGWSACDEFGA